jgi:hypothetical protein
MMSIDGLIVAIKKIAKRMRSKPRPAPETRMAMLRRVVRQHKDGIPADLRGAELSNADFRGVQLF